MLDLDFFRGWDKSDRDKINDWTDFPIQFSDQLSYIEEKMKLLFHKNPYLSIRCQEDPRHIFNIDIRLTHNNYRAKYYYGQRNSSSYKYTFQLDLSGKGDSLVMHYSFFIFRGVRDNFCEIFTRFMNKIFDMSFGALVHHSWLFYAMDYTPHLELIRYWNELNVLPTFDSQLVSNLHRELCRRSDLFGIIRCYFLSHLNRKCLKIAIREANTVEKSISSTIFSIKESYICPNGQIETKKELSIPLENQCVLCTTNTKECMHLKTLKNL